jgi:hypothetical protein
MRSSSSIRSVGISALVMQVSPRRRPATGLVAILAIVAMALAPAAGAQSPSPGASLQPGGSIAASSPGPQRFCGLLTDEEVGQALGFAVTAVSGSTFDCTWQGDVSAGDATSLSAGVEPGTIAADIKPINPGGTDLTVGASAAYYLDDTLWVEVGDRVLSLQRILASPGAPDALAMLTALATIAVARFDALGIPEAPSASPSPQPSFAGDVALKDRFPAEMGGKPVQVTTITGAEARARADARTRKILDQLVAALKPQGKSLDDVSVGAAGVRSGRSGAQLVGLRVQGADAAALLPLVTPLLVAEFLPAFGKPRQAPAQVGGKDVTLLTPAKRSPMAGQAYAYVYPHDDVVWMVAGPGDGNDAVVTETFQKLP